VAQPNEPVVFEGDGVQQTKTLQLGLSIYQERNYAPQLLFKRNHEETFRALHGIYDFIS